jgi:hypothetical protein
VFDGVGNADGCCQLCGATFSCTAWTVVKPTGPNDLGSCHLKSTVVDQQLDPQGLNCTTGILHNTRTHYANPNKPSTKCLSDETELYVRGINGSWCSTGCNQSAPCPLDVPIGVKAKPSCVVHNPLGDGKLCALLCNSDEDCGGLANLHMPYAGRCTLHSPYQIHICVYDELAGGSPRRGNSSL